MELRCRAQKANESLLGLAMEDERLVHLTYPGENHPLIDNIKTEAFVSGIRDPDIKLAVCSMQKATFALAQETARTISKPPVNKESATVHGKTEAKVTIANISVSHVFIVADIVDEVIIAADLMIAHGINLNMRQQIMSWRNVEKNYHLRVNH